MSLIGSQITASIRQDLENLVVHEAAHQWWYNQVGSDQTKPPWQDEGLAEWSMYAYYLARYGVLAAERLLADRWQVPIRYAIQTSTDRPIGLPVDSYGLSDYERTVYAKGALFRHPARRNRRGGVSHAAAHLPGALPLAHRHARRFHRTGERGGGERSRRDVLAMGGGEVARRSLFHAQVSAHRRRFPVRHRRHLRVHLGPGDGPTPSPQPASALAA